MASRAKTVNDIDAVYLGDVLVSAMYIGDVLIWVHFDPLDPESLYLNYQPS